MKYTDVFMTIEKINWTKEFELEDRLLTAVYYILSILLVIWLILVQLNLK